MEWLNPGLAWFAAGGAIPIIIHLLHRQRFLRVRWGAMQFLLNALRRTQRRIRLENLLLLAVRILILVLIAAAIARPVFRDAPIGFGQTDIHYIFVLDHSYSMGYKKAQTTALEAAKRSARELLERTNLTSDDTFTLILCSEYPEVRLGSAKKRAAAIQAVEEVELSDYGTSLAKTFALVEERLRTSENTERRVTIFTDMQRHGWTGGTDAEQARFAQTLARLCRDERARARFYLVDVGDEAPENVAVVGIETRDKVATVRTRTSFSVKIYNFSDHPVPQVPVTMQVDGVHKAERTVGLDPGSMAIETFEHEFLEPGPHRIRFATTPDFLSKDDARYLAMDVKDAVRVLIVDGAPGRMLESGTRFLQLALDPTGEGRLFKVDVRTPETLPPEEVERADAVVIADAQFLTPERVAKLEEFAAAGGGVMIALGPRADKDFYNRDLRLEGRGLLPATLLEVRGVERERIETGRARPVFLQKIRFDHPVFRTFRAEAMQPILYEIEFGQYWGTEVPADATVLARFNDSGGSPALVERAFGEGRVLLFTSTLNKDWGLFPARSAYLPIMVETVRLLASRPLGDRNLIVGDSIHYGLPVGRWAPEFRLVHVEPGQAGAITVSPDKPGPDQRRVYVNYPSAPRPPGDGGEARPEARMRNEGVRFAGHYALETLEPDQPPLTYFAVNLGPREPDSEGLAAAEGNLERISEEELRLKFPGFTFEVLSKGRETPAPVEASASGLWRLLLMATLLLLAADSVLACLFGRRKE